MSALEIRGLGVELGGRPIIHDLSVTLGLGRLVAVLGPNGAGKTTWLKALAGLTPYTGTILVDGADLAATDLTRRARIVGYLPQGHQASWPLPAHDIVALGRYAHGARDPARLGARDVEIVADAMARTDCEQFASRSIQTLSGGERARVMLARVLATQAPVILADEPTAALDPRHQIEVMSALKAEAARGALVLAVTHDVGLAARFADTVALLHRGRLVATGAPADVLDDARMAQVYGVTVHRPEVEGRRIVLPWSAL